MRSILHCSIALVVLVACAAARADEVTLKNGSKIIGEVLDLVDGKLRIKTVFAKEIVVDWPEVVGITTDKPQKVVTKGGSQYVGTTGEGEGGNVAIRTQEPALTMSVPLGTITAINPPPKPALTFKGFVAAGATVTDGNTQTKAFSANGEFEARAEVQRFTLRASTNYAQDTKGITARNSHGFIKYDYFMTKRFYAFASALFEGDKFQDLNLRTALSAGPGRQFIDIGDYQEPWLHDLQLFGEAGLSYFDEDFKNSPDQNYVAARWSVKLNWPIVPKKIVLFHFHEGYPGLERAADLYIATEQGVRFSIFQNFFAALQVNWRWDNTPAAGAERGDTVYLFSLGYNFELSR